jgi:Zn-dependent protease with chaperone function
MGIPAFYFDGKTSRRQRASLTVDAGIAIVSGETPRQCPVIKLRVSERLKSAARKVTFPDGAYLEILDNEGFDALLDATGHQDSLLVKVQQSSRYSLLACALTVAVLVFVYLYGLPVLAGVVAKALPESVERAIGQESLDFLDSRMFAPSELPLERQREIIDRFASLTPPAADTPQYEIVFRSSRIGPNAFALPSGHIILTDEIVELLGNDDALIGVISHELGHLHERHLLRRIIQNSAIGATATVIFGDVSSIVANIPTLMLDLQYSRDAESEADDYAVAMLKANGINPTALAEAFESLDKEMDERTPYLSSHPPASERIERIRDGE